MSWLFFALISLFSFVFYDVSGRYFATRSENPQVFAVIYNAAVSLLAPLLFFLDPTKPTNITSTALIFTFIGLIIWGLFGRFEYIAKKHTEASTLTIIAKLAPVASFFLALIFLGETGTPSKFIGITLIVIANLLLFMGSSKTPIVSDKGLKYSLAISLLLAIGWILDAINVKTWGVATFCTFSFFSPMILSSIFPRITISQLKHELSLTPLWQIIILAFFNLAGYAAMLKALSLGDVSKVIPIVTSTSPFIVLFGVIILGERTHIGRKFFASTLAVLAIYLMR